MNTSQGIWKAIKTPAFMGVIIPLPCLRVQPQLQWASRLSGGLTRGGRLSANAGELGEPNRTTSRYARAVHTSQNEFAVQLNTYSEKCLDNGTLFSFLPQELIIFEMIHWPRGLSFSFDLRLSSHTKWTDNENSLLCCDFQSLEPVEISRLMIFHRHVSVSKLFNSVLFCLYLWVFVCDSSQLTSEALHCFIYKTNKSTEPKQNVSNRTLMELNVEIKAFCTV